MMERVIRLAVLMVRVVMGMVRVVLSGVIVVVLVRVMKLVIGF